MRFSRNRLVRIVRPNVLAILGSSPHIRTTRTDEIEEKVIQTSNIINALPLVADVLGRRYGVKVLIGGSRAYTNGKDIHIPALPLDADETVLNLARGYLDHEAAHLRNTDFAALESAGLSAIERHIWNIIEDFMVEEKLSAIYPGCRDNFIWLIKHLFLMESNTKEAEGYSLDRCIFSWILISLRALAVPELDSERNGLAKEMDRSYPELRRRLEPIVTAIPSDCACTVDCIFTARKIVCLLNDYVSSRMAADVGDKPRGHSGESSTNSAIGDMDYGKMTSENSRLSGEMAKTNRGTHVQPDKSITGNLERDSSQSSNNSNMVDESDTQVKAKDCAGKAIKSLQEVLGNSRELECDDIGSLIGRRLEDVNQHGDFRQITVAVAKPSTGQAFCEKEIAEIRRATAALRTRLSALLQAKVLVRNRPGQTGRIDTSSLARLAVNDARIFVRHGIKQNVNTAIHILLDASGSMQYNGKMVLASQTCFAVACALQQISGIGVAVTAFPNGLRHNGYPMRWQTVAPVLEHKQKIHNRFRLTSDGGTPMAEALWWVLQQMRPLQEKRKILLIVSDGAPDNLDEAQNAIAGHIAQRHEVFGIGICTEAMKKVIGERNSSAIYDLRELAPAMFTLLQNNL